MEDIIYGKGVFIPSRNLNSTFMIECLQSLVGAYPGLNIASVFYDENYKGYRISFKDSEAVNVLKNRNVKGTYGNTPLYPLTTFLIVHDVNLIGHNDIEKDLCDMIQKNIGKVLFVREFSTTAKNGAASFLVSVDVPESKDLNVFGAIGYPNMSLKFGGKSEALKTEFWCRDCKTHGHFFQECLSKESNSDRVPERRNSYETNERRKIAMHSRQQSDAKLLPMNLTTDTSRLTTSLRTDPIGFTTKDIEAYPSISNFLESTESFAGKVAREQIMQAGLLGDKDASKEQFKRTETNELASKVADSLLLGRNLDQELYINAATVEPRRNETLNQNYGKAKTSESTSATTNSLTSNNIPINTEIKSEVEDNDPNISVPTKRAESQDVLSKNTTNKTSENSVKKEPDNILRNDENTHPFPSDDTNESDGDIQVINPNDNTSSNSTSHLNFREAFSSLRDKAPATESGEIKKESIYPDHVQNVDPPFKSPTHTPTSSLNTKRQQSRPSMSSTTFEALTDQQLQEYFSGVSYNASPNVTRQQPKATSSAEVTSCLSDRLQDCINYAYSIQRVLDRKTLDAFLIHVKKKSNPIRVAGNYTANVQGLKDQLKEILSSYYNTPQTGTKEDIQFIKWLNGLVERFDGTVPRKRKNNKQNSDEPSAKK